MEGKSLKDVYNRLIDLYGFYEINKDSDEYKIALRFMSQEDLLKDDIDNIRLLVKDDGEDYMYFIINESPVIQKVWQGEHKEELNAYQGSNL